MKGHKHIDKLVGQTYKKYKIGDKLSKRNLEEIFNNMGYHLKPYSLEDREYFGKSVPPAYTSTSEKGNFIFYDDALSDNDKLIAFSHELGHILLNHGHRHNGPYDTSTYQEYEAGVFAYRFINYKINLIKKWLITAMVLIIVAMPYVNQHNNPDVQYRNIPFTEYNATEINVPNTIDEVIITSTGTKYHNPSCGHIKNRENLKTITIKEATELGYKECLDCF